VQTLHQSYPSQFLKCLEQGQTIMMNKFSTYLCSRETLQRREGAQTYFLTFWRKMSKGPRLTESLFWWRYLFIETLLRGASFFVHPLFSLFFSSILFSFLAFSFFSTAHLFFLGKPIHFFGCACCLQKFETLSLFKPPLNWAVGGITEVLVCTPLLENHTY